VKLRAVLTPGRILRRLRGMDAAIRDAARDAAAEALRNELTRAGENVISVEARGSSRAVGSSDPADAARELGTLELPPSPWLAPALPTALEPMRAAASTAAARTVSSFGKRKK